MGNMSLLEIIIVVPVVCIIIWVMWRIGVKLSK